METTNHPVLLTLLLVGTAVGVTSIQDIDVLLAVILKCVSILSFTVAAGYGIWKWRSEYKKSK